MATRSLRIQYAAVNQCGVGLPSQPAYANVGTLIKFIKTKRRRRPSAVMAALLKEWLVEDLKIKSPCAQLEKVQPRMCSFCFVQLLLQVPTYRLSCDDALFL